jgi:phosphatidylglycerol:prolipoprotein diacylglycerol transferase
MKHAWKFRDNDIDTLLYYIFFGVLLWGRIGYVLLYNPWYFLAHPSEIFAFWNGGMSFHGGFLGVLIAVFAFARLKKYSFFAITDVLAVIIPVALGLGRIGNSINQELLGFSPYNWPFAVVVNGVSHFPSPLFEMLLEGILLFGIMFSFWKLRPSYFKLRTSNWFLSSIFLIGYATMRLIAEQFRLPDSHIGYLFGTDFITIGMIYTLPMFVFGLYLLSRTMKK